MFVDLLELLDMEPSWIEWAQSIAILCNSVTLILLYVQLMGLRSVHRKNRQRTDAEITELDGQGHPSRGVKEKGMRSEHSSRSNSKLG